jgi:hypothetical protein
MVPKYVLRQTQSAQTMLPPTAPRMILDLGLNTRMKGEISPRVTYAPGMLRTPVAKTTVLPVSYG